MSVKRKRPETSNLNRGDERNTNNLNSYQIDDDFSLEINPEAVHYNLERKFTDSQRMRMP